MVCVECFVVPVVFLLLSFAKQIFTYVYSFFVPPQETPAPPPFDPACINLAAHGLAPPASTDSATTDASSSKKTVSYPEDAEDDGDDEEEEEEDAVLEETKEAPLIRKKAVNA
jgi:hypothetical protein